VDSQRNNEDPYLESGPGPKLSLVGRLDGEIDGRPVSLVAENGQVVLAAEKLLTLLTLRRIWKSSRSSLRRVLETVGMRVLIRSRWFGTAEVLPKPSFVIRLLLPRAS
jgi:hypothetical protein